MFKVIDGERILSFVASDGSNKQIYLCRREGMSNKLCYVVCQMYSEQFIDFNANVIESKTKEL